MVNKELKRERNKRYYAAHADEIRAKARVYAAARYHEDPIGHQIAAADWVAANQERRREYLRNYYLQHRDHIRAKQAEYRKTKAVTK